MTPAALRRRRKALGLSQVALAELCGVAPNTIARRERGELPINREASLALDAVEANFLDRRLSMAYTYIGAMRASNPQTEEKK